MLSRDVHLNQDARKEKRRLKREKVRMLGDADISEETLFALPSQVREKNVLLHFWRLITLPATSYLIKDMMFNMFSLVTRLI